MSAYTSHPVSSAYEAWGRRWTPAVKWIMLANLAVFLAQWVFASTPWFGLFTLQLPEMVTHLRWWQPFTYLFLHAGFWHIFFNLFNLWMFGSEVESALGTRKFIFYYFLTGAGAGLGVAGLGMLFHEHSATLGASGAVFGILAAYGLLFAERRLTLLVFFVLPVQMKAKTMVWIFAAIEFVAGVSNAFGNVSHIAHLSGMLIGYLYFLVTRPDLTGGLNLRNRFRLHRAGRNVRTTTPNEDPELYVDEILDKISKQGIGSLNTHERRIMAEAARRRREKGTWPGNN
jgi:membrane associated rhomboid family serine protease